MSLFDAKDEFHLCYRLPGDHDFVLFAHFCNERKQKRIGKNIPGGDFPGKQKDPDLFTKHGEGGGRGLATFGDLHFRNFFQPAFGFQHPKMDQPQIWFWNIFALHQWVFIKGYDRILQKRIR